MTIVFIYPVQDVKMLISQKQRYNNSLRTCDIDLLLRK